jgi:hypothetical protein
MKKSDLNDILAYIRGSLDSGREKELKKRLSEAGYDLEELDVMRDMDAQLGKISIPKPGKAMSTRFYNVLETYKQEQAVRMDLFKKLRVGLDRLNFRRVMAGMAYSAVLLFIGWSAGVWFTPNASLDSRLTVMSSELQEMKALMTVALLDNPSPAERIKAVNIFADMAEGDETVIDKLLEILNQDPNVNVRLVALEAIIPFMDTPKVKGGLIQAIGRQNSPLLQLALTDAMVSMQEKEAVDPLKRMLEQKDLNLTVRGRIERGLELLI